MTENQHIEGIVKAVKQRDKNYAVLLEVGENWYGGYGVSPVEKEDNVHIEWKLSTDGKWKNIVHIDKKEGEPETEQKTFEKGDEFKTDKQDIISTQTAGKIMGRVLEKIIEKDTNNSEALIKLYGEGHFTELIAEESKRLVSLWR